METLYFPGSVKDENLAEKILFNLIDKLKRTDRGIKSRNDLFVLRYTTMPAVLVECGFLSNSEERELLCDDNYRDDLVAAIFCGISKYFKI
ncbi:N-acetylmuramoyl-L-alanine amidase family protein [Natronospora cellulosivora (SeqCode)]